MVISLAGCQNAFVVMCESHKVNSITFAEVSVDFLASFKVEKTHRKVVAAGHEVLAIM